MLVCKDVSLPLSVKAKENGIELSVENAFANVEDMLVAKNHQWKIKSYFY